MASVLILLEPTPLVQNQMELLEAASPETGEHQLMYRLATLIIFSIPIPHRIIITALPIIHRRELITQL